MKLNIVLVEPEIPQNTGNIVRTCAATGAKLHKTMRIPMIDGIRCLNLSNAVSILAYEVLRHTNFEHLKETSERLLGN